MITTVSRPLAIVITVVAASVTMLVMDLTFLGVIASGFYDAQLGGLRAPAVYWPAAGAFYALYLGALMVHAVLPAKSLRNAASRGAGMGLLAYGTYDLTNWAVIRDWPGLLVPVDMAWGVLLTGTAAAAGYAVWSRLGHGGSGFHNSNTFNNSKEM